MICCSCGKEIYINYGREYWNGLYCKKCADEMLSTPEDAKKYEKIIADLKAENAELKEKAQKLDEQLKAISDRTAKFPSLEQIEKRFLDWAIPFLKARITGCKEEWFGIEWIAKAIWEFIKDGFENAIAVDETNAALRERLDKSVELPAKVMINQTLVNGKFKPTQKAQAFNGRIGVVYRDETKWKGLLVDICSEKVYDYEAAEKRLAELGGEK